MNAPLSSETKSSERIICAAIRHPNGAIICGARHFDEIMCLQIQATNQDWRRAEQGFINQHGDFICREEAYEIATEQKQIIREIPHTGKTLYSEHLY